MLPVPLGLEVPIIAEGISSLSGLERSLGMDLVIIVLWTGLFGASCYVGLDKGIKRLAD